MPDFNAGRPIVFRNLDEKISHPFSLINHNCVAGNLTRKFGNHLEGKPCTPFMADMKVRLGRDYVYPDVVVDCSKMSGSDMFSENPVLIVEVLSKSTRKTDTAVKLLRYINLPLLQEYVLIEPDFVWMRWFASRNCPTAGS